MIPTIKNKPSLLLALVASCFFLLYNWLYITTPNIYNSPDETANFVFVKNFIETNDLTISLSKFHHDIVRPRSVNISGGNFVPGSFIGLILLLGLPAKFLGFWLIFIFPSLLAVAGVLSFYGLLKTIFSQRIALYSGILLFFMPPWWHYASRGYLTNVPFLSLLLIGTFSFIKAQQTKAWYWSVAAGSSFFWSFFIRPSEIWWMSLLVLIVFLVNFKKIHRKNFFFTGLAMVLAGGIAAYWQFQTYGGLFQSGYSQFLSTDQGTVAITQTIVSTIFPFGLKILTSFYRFWVFTFSLYWWFFSFGIIGLIVWFKSNDNVFKQRLFVGLWLMISLYLIVYYGSWTVIDDLDGDRVSVGISYLRYWLPIYLGFVPFVVIGLQTCGFWFHKEKRTLIFHVLFGLILLVSSIYVYGYDDDNLGKIKQNIVKYKDLREQILALTPSDAIIISERNDKIFWPTRQVIHFQNQNFDFVKELPKILRYSGDGSVYWFTLLPDEHVDVWEQKVFEQQGLRLNKVKNISEYSLYQITEIK